MDYLKIDLRNMDELIQERFPNKDLVTLEELIGDYTETLWEMQNDKEHIRDIERELDENYVNMPDEDPYEARGISPRDFY